MTAAPKPKATPEETEKRVERQRTHWNDLAPVYDTHYSLREQTTLDNVRRKAGLIVEAATITERSSVLELGCGTGALTRILEKTGATVTGLDISPRMIEQAAMRKKRKETTLMVGDCHHLPFAAGTFDNVVGLYVLQYVDVGTVLAEVRRVLKPTGATAFIEINVLHPLAYAKTRVGWVKRRCNVSQDAVSFLSWRLKKHFERAGLAKALTRTLWFTWGSSFLVSSRPQGERGTAKTKEPNAREPREN